MLYAHGRMWKVAAVLSAVSSALLAVVVGIMASKASVVPVVVGLDRERGEPVVIGPVQAAQFMPGPNEVRFFLTQLVQNVRAVPLDPVVMRRSWEQAYAYLTSDAATQMSEWARRPDSNVSQVGKRTITVQPIAIVQVAHSDSYQARWLETVYDSTGRVLEEYAMTGIFTVVRKEPATEQSVWMNPLGLYVSSFQWSRDLAPDRNEQAQRVSHES
jgi:type IV secretion system protein VirB5